MIVYGLACAAVCDVILRETGQEVTEFTPIESLDVDSLELLDLLMEIERETGIAVPDARIAELQTVGDIVKVAA